MIHHAIVALMLVNVYLWVLAVAEGLVPFPVFLVLFMVLAYWWGYYDEYRRVTRGRTW